MTSQDLFRDGVTPLVVSVADACRMLDCSHSFLYQLLADDALDSFHAGRSRKITVASIERYVERRVAEDRAARQAPNVPPPLPCPPPLEAAAEPRNALTAMLYGPA